MPKAFLIFAPLFAASMFAPTRFVAQSTETEPIDYFPKQTLAFAELNRTGDWLNRGLLDALLERVSTNGILSDQDQSEIRQALTLGRLFAGEDPVDLAGKLTSGGVAAGVLRTDEGVSFGLVLESVDAQVLDAALERGFALLEEKVGAKGLFGNPHDTYRGVNYWKLGDKLAIGYSDRTLVLASNADTLKLLIDEASDDLPGLSGRSDFGLSADQEVGIWADRIAFTAFRNDQGEDTTKLDALVEAVHLPEVQFLLGPGLADLGSSASFSATLDFETSGVELNLVGHGPTKQTGLEPTAPGPSPLLAAENAVASGMLFRDVAAIVSRSHELFAPEVQPKFSKALSDLALLFGGMDLSEQLLPSIDPWIEFTIQDMDFGDSPKPALPLPGAAIVLSVKPQMKDVLVAGFQTTLGITNTGRAQQGKPPFTLGLGLEAEVLITSGHMPRPQGDAAVDNSFNFAPSAAWIDGTARGRFVLGTHEAVVRDVVRQLKASEATQPVQRSVQEALRVSGVQLSKLIENGHDYLVMKAVLDEGKAPEEAEQDVRNLIQIAQLFHEGLLRVNYLKGAGIQVGIELELKEPLVKSTESTSQTGL